MPNNLGRGAPKPKKTILKPDEVAVLLAEARRDPERGLYVAFGFLVGTRISEQLGLLWDCVDFERNVIVIRRIQERDGSLSEVTKTASSRREIPMSPQLREWLLEWKLRCPRLDGQLHRVFGGPGRLQKWPLPRVGGGGPLIYQNFRRRMWAPIFERLDVPYVSPHAARHSFISGLQLAGVEIPLAAALAGHANPAITLSHYSHALRGGESAMAALSAAFLPPSEASAS